MAGSFPAFLFLYSVFLWHLFSWDRQLLIWLPMPLAQILLFH